jgi:hypothetical protein
MEAVKSGLKPGFLDVAGYGMSAYNIYDNLNRMQKGEISQNDAVIGITREVVDTGFGMITDTGMAAAVGAIGTGKMAAAATIGAPLVIVAGAGYAVSTAVEEGLRTFEAFKVEKIAEKIAKSKKEEVINRLQLQAEEALKAGETTGDWRHFAKADDIADSLERMYKVTGDDDFKRNFDAVYGMVASKKEQLEAKYNCSIYAVQSKMREAGTDKIWPPGGKADSLPPFKIAGSINSVQGPAISGPLQNGDILEFLAEVEHPASETLLATQLFWQVYDAGKQPVAGLNKSLNTYEKGGKKPYTFRFRLDNMNNGEYTVALAHRLVSNPDVSTQAVFPFRVFQEVKIDRLVVTDGKGDQENKTEMHPGDAPQMFVYYTLAANTGKVKVALTAKESTSGRVIESTVVERPRDGEAPPYRVGLGLPAGLLKAGDRIAFEARIMTRDGKTQAADTAFRIIPEKYELKIMAPKMIVGDQVADYALVPPDVFEPPFIVDVSGGPLVVKKTADPLRGKFQGPATTTTKSHTLNFLVRDAKNRTASGIARVTVRGLDPATLSGRNQPQPVYVPPQKTSPRAASKDADGGQADYQQKQKETMDAYTKEKMRIRQEQDAKNKEIRQKYQQQPTPQPAAPYRTTGSAHDNSQSRQKACRSFTIDASDCRSAFYSCMGRCPKAGMRGVTRSAIQNCHDQCGSADKICTRTKCPGGTLSGTGWNLKCTVCQ